jgi:hypothetical protein
MNEKPKTQVGGNVNVDRPLKHESVVRHLGQKRSPVPGPVDWSREIQLDIALDEQLRAHMGVLEDEVAEPTRPMDYVILAVAGGFSLVIAGLGLWKAAELIIAVLR